MWIKKVIVSYSRHKGNLKQLILAGLLLLSQGDILLAQSRMSAERAWADQFRQCTLVVIYPTFAVKHERFKPVWIRGMPLQATAAAPKNKCLSIVRIVTPFYWRCSNPSRQSIPWDLMLLYLTLLITVGQKISSQPDYSKTRLHHILHWWIH